MTKVRKQKRKKVYRYNVNRKRMKNKMKRPPKVKNCDQVKEKWNDRVSPKENFKTMGLTYHVDDTFKIPTGKPEFHVTSLTPDEQAPATDVAMELEAEAKAPRVKKLRLPNSHVYWLTKLLDKHGEDYKAMERDKKLNYFQNTWRQLRQKVNRLKAVPEQWNDYLRHKAEQEAA